MAREVGLRQGRKEMVFEVWGEGGTLDGFTKALSCLWPLFRFDQTTGGFPGMAVDGPVGCDLFSEGRESFGVQLYGVVDVHEYRYTRGA